MLFEPKCFTITRKICYTYPPASKFGALKTMDKFLVPGGSGVIVLSASAQARTEKDARRLNLLNALKATFRSRNKDLFPSKKPARRPRVIERAAEKFVSQQVNLHMDVAVHDVDVWATNIVNSFYKRKEGASLVACF